MATEYTTAREWADDDRVILTACGQCAQGVHSRPQGGGNPRDTEREAMALTLRALGWSVTEVAAELGISRQRVHQIIGRAATERGLEPVVRR